MKERILQLLVCPACHRKLTLDTFSQENGEIREGLLECGCGEWFPVTRFVPRMLLGEYRGDYRRFLTKHGLKHLKNFKPPKGHRSPKTQVQKSFSSKWTSQPLWGTQGETKEFMKEWMLNKYGWGNLKSLRESLESRRFILDAGTGLGREAIQFAELCTAGDVLGIDLSEAVDAAYANTRVHPNIHIIQADHHEPSLSETCVRFYF